MHELCIVKFITERLRAVSINKTKEVDVFNSVRIVLV